MPCLSFSVVCLTKNVSVAPENSDLIYRFKGEKISDIS